MSDDPTRPYAGKVCKNGYILVREVAGPRPGWILVGPHPSVTRTATCDMTGPDWHEDPDSEAGRLRHENAQLQQDVQLLVNVKDDDVATLRRLLTKGLSNNGDLTRAAMEMTTSLRDSAAEAHAEAGRLRALLTEQETAMPEITPTDLAAIEAVIKDSKHRGKYRREIAAATGLPVGVVTQGCRLLLKQQRAFFARHPTGWFHVETCDGGVDRGHTSPWGSDE